MMSPEPEVPSAAARAACDGGSEVPTDTSAVGGSMVERMTGGSWFVLLGGCQRRRLAMVSACKMSGEWDFHWDLRM